MRRSLIARRTTLQCPRSRSTEANNKRMSIYRQLCMLLFKLITGRTSERLLSSNRKRQDNHRSMYSYLCSMNWHGSAASRLCRGTHLITRMPMLPRSNAKSPATPPKERLSHHSRSGILLHHRRKSSGHIFVSTCRGYIQFRSTYNIANMIL